MTVTADTREASDALLTAQTQTLANQPHLWHHDDDLSHVRIFLTPEQTAAEGQSFRAEATVQAP